MKALARILVVSGFLTSAAGLLVLPQFAASPAQQIPGMDHSVTAPNEPTPAFHAQAPTDALPPTMEPALFTDTLTFNAYVIASRVKKILYQQPCYCHCDRSQGHGSLLDCFVGRHGSGCDICQKEDFYSYEQTRNGKTPAQIRAGIMHGDWQNVDTTKYAKAQLPASGTPAK
ncbi:MAG TPA: CYCXC family (seleno)protein [Candidatus Acidoferrum sp.]|nr:CYCXC family (seleno)protein [Candidatus Acidoferrum sp.]